MRRSTVGRAVLDGNGLAVSEGRAVPVKVSVGEIVCVALGATASVTGANDVFVGTLVSNTVGGIGVVDVKVQANNVNIHRTDQINFRLIPKLYSPFRLIYPNDKEVTEYRTPA